MITISRIEQGVVPLRAEDHQVHLSLVSGCVVADCVCGLHAASFSTQREVFDFLANHRAGHIRSIPTGVTPDVL